MLMARLAVVLLVITLTCLTFAQLGQRAGRRISIAVTLVNTFFLFRTDNELEMNDKTQLPEGEQRIPTIVHQVKLGSLAMRPAWTKARQSCVDLHPQWDFKLWQNADANHFVEQHYPELNATYRNYPLEIQRSNVLRYLLLDHFGGFYLDLDLRCRRSLDSLRSQTFVTPPANPTGVNNAFIASTAHHPFWTHLRSHVRAYDLGWFNSPYVTNMMSTGCHFFSTMHRTYDHHGSLTILDQANKLNGHVVTPLFEHLGASSWHKGDAKMILKLGRSVEWMKIHKILTYGAFATSILLLIIVFRVFKRPSNREANVLLSIEEAKGLETC